jgi:hypothetical protein
MKTNRTIAASVLSLVLLNCTTGLGQEAHALFQKKEVLKITVESNMKVLLKDRGENPIYHWGRLTYMDEQGDSVVLPLKIKVRGNFRRSAVNCKFPPLMLDFPQKKGKKTLFHGQNKLKLVTECQKEDYVFHEYLTYEMYNLVTPFSFKARLTEVTYIDSAGKRKPEVAYGFFLENEEQLGKRNRAKNFYNKNLSMALMDSVDMATVALFEYLIGNNDWSIGALHNIKLFTQTGKLFIPVPYDFDHAGIVEAPYALPPPQLEIASVRERLYRGLNYSPNVFQMAFDKFNSLKPQIYALYEGNPLLSSSYIKRTTKYIDEFYEAINDPKAIKKYFVAGRTKN